MYRGGCLERMQISHETDNKVRIHVLIGNNSFRLTPTTPIMIPTTIIKLSLHYDNNRIDKTPALPASVKSLELNMRVWESFDFSSLPPTLKKITIPKSLQYNLSKYFLLYNSAYSYSGELLESIPQCIHVKFNLYR